MTTAHDRDDRWQKEATVIAACLRQVGHPLSAIALANDARSAAADGNAAPWQTALAAHGLAAEIVRIQAPGGPGR